MEKDVMITWIIPVYNGEKYLSQAIDSILRQPCSDLQILVIDDGSTDSSLKIAQGYTDPRVKAIHKENGGVSSARNLGIEHAHSKYIAFLDADDLLCRDAYDEEIHNILLTGQYDLLSFSYCCGDQQLKYGNIRVVTDGEVEGIDATYDPFKHCSSFIYRHGLFEGKGGIRFPNGIKIREDVTFQFLAYQRTSNMLCDHRCWFVYRNNITSVVHSQKTSDFLIHHVIPAWSWCKNQCSNEAARKQCDIWLFSEATEYIRLSCMEGTPIQIINNAMNTEAIKEAMADESILWRNRKAIFDSFMANPRKYWLKQRPRGILINAARFLVRLPIIRDVYMKSKYKENIESLV